VIDGGPRKVGIASDSFKTGNSREKVADLVPAFAAWIDSLETVTIEINKPAFDFIVETRRA
jgi:hypothetical protein